MHGMCIMTPQSGPDLCAFRQFDADNDLVAGPVYLLIKNRDCHHTKGAGQTGLPKNEIARS
jgi:hypothetical protein